LFDSSLEDDLVVGLDANTGQLLHYDNEPDENSVKLELDVGYIVL
jgi:hypothetical protein